MAVNLDLLNSNSINNIESNFQRVDVALQDAVSRSGTTPNQMNADLDMNSNDLLNVGEIDANSITIQGLPIGQFNGTFQGLWNSSTTYVVNDVVRDTDGNLWIAERTNINISPIEGDDWTLFMPVANSITDGDKGDIIVSDSGATWEIERTVDTETVNAYTPTISDANTKVIRLVDATSVALTIPLNSSVAYDIGDVLTFEQGGAGQVTITGDVGVTVRVPTGQVAVSASQYSIFQLLKIAEDEWLLFGDLESSQIGYLLGSTQVFTSSGTWTKPAGCTAVKVTVVGGGAGGGGVTGVASNAAAGGGGGAGGFAQKWITSALGPTETITIGAGGSGGAAGNNAGTNGGSSSFGSHVSATGGTGGGGMVAGTSVTTATGGAGGTGVNGDVNVESGVGNRGLRLGSSMPIAGTGGNSPLGFGGQTNVNNTGGSASAYGGGGAGAASVNTPDKAGGSGTSGIVIVEEYY